MRRTLSSRLIPAVTLVVLTTTACIDGNWYAAPVVEVAPITPSAAASSDPGPVVSAGASKPLVETRTTEYKRTHQFLGWREGEPARGLTETSHMENCRAIPECNQGNTAENQSLLIEDVLANAADGGSTITCSGTVDARTRVIGAERQIQLSQQRANACGDDFAARLRNRNPGLNVIGTEDALEQGVDCTAPGTVCIRREVNSSIIKACGSGDDKVCEERLRATDTGDRGRAARSSVTFSRRVAELCPEGTRLAGLPMPADRNCDPTSTTSTTSTTVAPPIDTLGRDGSVTPDPSRGIFGPGPGGSIPSGTSTPGGPSSDETPFYDDTDSYCDTHPADCLDLNEILDEVTVRIVVSVPDSFVVGGKLREQDVRVTDVALYCGGRPCSDSVNIAIESFEGRLDLTPSSARYVRCATESARGCAYYVATDSTLAVALRSGRLSSNLLRAGFFSATPANTWVRPTLLLEELTVARLGYSWIGGAGCNGTTPPRACWEVYAGTSVDLRVNADVRATKGTGPVRSGDAFRFDRRVVGTVGS